MNGIKQKVNDKRSFAPQQKNELAHTIQGTFLAFIFFLTILVP